MEKYNDAGQPGDGRVLAIDGTPLDLEEIRQTYRDRKIEGIRYVRDRTGLGIAAAKALFEGEEAPPAGTQQAPVESAFSIEEVRQRYKDRKIEGIQYIRERTGLGLAEAKALFEGVTPDQTGKKAGWIWWLLLAVVIALGLGIWWFLFR